MLLTSVISALALPLLALANPHGSGAHARHAELAKRAAGHVDIHKRFSGTRWTFYDVGLGACGKYNSRNDFIVALNSAQYGGGYPGPNCFKQISMTYNGKTTTATIMDECPGCPFGGLDLSRGLFDFFASESLGVIYGDWNFIGGGGGGGGGDQPKPKPPPKTTWKPTTTWKPPKPTTTWTPDPEPTTTTHKTTSTPKPTTSDDPTTSSTSTKTTSSSAPAIAPTPSSANNLNVLGSVLINLGGIAVAGAAGNQA